VLKKAGLEGRDTVFLFSDTQIVQEGFLEDLNNILNAGKMHTALVAPCCSCFSCHAPTSSSQANIMHHSNH
jgi:hypothetical protein